MALDRLRIAIRAFDPFESAIRNQFEDWRAGRSIALECVTLDVEPLYHALFVDDGLRSGRFDIAFVVTDWLPIAIAGGHLADLTALIAADMPDYRQAWPASLLGAQESAGRIYGLPYHDGPQCLIYRRDLFEDPDHRKTFAKRTGRKLAVPRTWDEFREVVKYFSRPADGFYGTVVAAFPDRHNTVYDFCLQVWSRGGEIVEPDGRPRLDSPEAIAGLDFYRALVSDPGLVVPGATRTDSVRSGQIFAEGRAAMMTNWFGFATLAHDSNSAVHGRLGVAPIPGMTAEHRTSFLTYWVLAIGSGSAHRDLAYDFLSHATSPPMDRLTMLAGGVGCRLSTWADPEILARIPFVDQLADLHSIARTWPDDPALPDLTQVIDELISTALRTDTTSAELLKLAQRRAVTVFGPNVTGTRARMR